MITRMMKLARVRACVVYDATYDDATDPESSGANTRVRFIHSFRDHVVAACSLQLATCNLADPVRKVPWKCALYT